ncbi:MAG: ribonuclease III [Kiritimatiellia bacterium]
MLQRLIRNPQTKLEKRLGYRFRRRELLLTALTHRSYRFENPAVKEDNQRLEYLGDAVLNLVAARQLFAKFSDRDEGFLTAIRSCITSSNALAEVARSVELGEFIRLGKGEERTGGRSRNSILADALEAVLGAAFLDGGLSAVEKIYRRLFGDLVEKASINLWAENPKGLLQEIAQSRWHRSPEYRLVGKEGPGHATVFTVQVLVGGKIMGTGQGRNKQAAEKQAAIRVLRSLGIIRADN